MAGGHATQLGIQFQNEVSAVLATHVLAELPYLPFGLKSDVVPVRLQPEALSPVDDLLVKNSDGGFCFLNIKRNVQISSRSDSDLSSVVEQFVRQMLAMRFPSGVRDWERSLEVTRDRFVLVTSGQSVGRLVSAAEGLEARVANAADLGSVRNAALTAAQRALLDTVLNLANTHWKRHAGSDASQEDLLALLRVMRVVRMDLGAGATTTHVLGLLRQLVVESAADAQTAWTALVAICGEMAGKRGSTDQAGLRKELAARGIALKSIPRVDRDVERLKQFTVETLKSLHHLAGLVLPDSSPTSKELIIERHATDAIAQRAKTGSFLVVGDPGAGKSGALHGAALQLQKEGYRTVVIAVDQHRVASTRELAIDIGLKDSLVEVLGGWSGDKPGILIIDALDAARGGPSEPVFQRLIRDVLTALPTWHVVASIREFDLRYGVVYRNLFSGTAPEIDLRHPDFAQVSHIWVKRLAPSELEQLWQASPVMEAVHKQASRKLRELLSSPFNLFLLSNILRSRSKEDVTRISTQVGLLDEYWSYRVIDHDAQSAQREAQLSGLVAEMVRERSLSLSGNRLLEREYPNWGDLFSRGVLAALRFRAEQIILFGFSHHMLFDYAVARLLLASGQATTFSETLTQSDDLALLLSPGAVLALRMLWEESGSHDLFWQRSFELAQTTAVGSFCRMLPARVSADSTGRIEDWSAVYDALSGTDAARATAARFLIGHTIGALTLGSFPRDAVFGPTAKPWTSIIRRCAEIDISELRFKLRPFLYAAITPIDTLTAEQQADVGVVSRLLLALTIKDASDESGVALGIQGVAKAFASDPQASTKSLSAVLEPTRIAEHGHSDLFWLAGEIDGLLKKGPAAAQIIRATYIAAFCVPLPSSKAETRLGGRILPLRSNQRQDFEGVRYRLVEDYDEFVRNHSVEAAAVLVEAMEYQQREEGRTPREREVATGSFQFRNHKASYKEDWSIYWQNYRKNDAIALLHQFKKALIALIDDGRMSSVEAILDYVAAHNSLGSVWATLLEIGAQRPNSLGVLLSTLLAQQIVLDGQDTTKPAGDLIAAIFPQLGESDRRGIEAAILKASEHIQRRLFSCIEENDLVSAEAASQRSQLLSEGQLLPNTDLFSMDVHSGEIEKDWWLKEKGVDVDAPQNRKLSELFRSLEGEINAARNNKDLIRAHGLWESAQVLLRELREYPNAPEPLRMGGWSALADAADIVSLASKTPEDAARFPELFNVIKESVADDKWPLPVADESHERNFAKGASWGSPCPRVNGAQAIVAFSRAVGVTTGETVDLIRRLARDPMPEVRFQIAGRINMLFHASADLMYEVIDYGFMEEQNEAVVSGLLSAAWRVTQERPKWFSERLVAVRQRFPERVDDGDRIEPLWTQTIVKLCIEAEDAVASEYFWKWAKESVKFQEHVRTTLSYLRSAITLGDVERTTDRDERVRKYANSFFFETTKSSVEVANRELRLHGAPNSDPTALQAAVPILDGVATELYFGSGAYAARGGGKLASAEVSRRFLREFGPTLNLLAEAPYPSITHHLLETLEAHIDIDPEFVFRVAMKALNDGGKRSGYSFESLGVTLFDRIVRRYLADHRALISKSSEYRKDLMAALDVFVDSGWREARELVYELPEMLR
jgi:hypothetical protein